MFGLSRPCAAVLICALLLPLASARAQNPARRADAGVRPLEQTQIPAAEYAALVALYDSAGGAAWTHPWTLPTDQPCSLYGVACSGGHVARLDLRNNQMSGTIPPELGNLSGLRELYLGGNPLTGSIPPELGNLANLTALFIYGTQVSGSIPVELGNLSNLVYLYLDGNQLTGSIPTELGGLSKLAYLYLGGNQLSGTIPSSLGSLAALQTLYLSNGQLSGPMPAELGGMTSLRQLKVAKNQLSGALPSALGDLANLEYLDLRWNQLSGSIPSRLGDLSKLQVLVLGANQLTGGVPPQLGHLLALKSLYLDHNSLSGPLPQALTNLGPTTFWFGSTSLCEPPDVAFQAWLAGISDLQRTSILCESTPSTHFGPASEWWDGYKAWAPQNRYPRMTGDVDGDGDDDAVAFNPDLGVYVALSTGTALAKPAQWSSEFAWLQGNSNWRALGDVDGDGKADIVGFKPGDGSVYVALSTGTGFAAASVWSANYGFFTPQATYPRLVGDVNGDGLADVVAIHPVDGVYFSLSTGTAFASPTWGSTETGWMSDARNWVALGDVDADGDADLVNFRYGEGVYVALSNGTSYGARTLWWDGLKYWGPDQRYPRLVGDVTGDGRADVVAWNPDSGGYVGVSTGAAFLKPEQWTTDFAIKPNSYNLHALGDLNGDGRQDAVCFIYGDGFYVALASWD